MIEDNYSQTRKTFEDVLLSQQELTALILKHYKGKYPLEDTKKHEEDKTERETFVPLVCHALLSQVKYPCAFRLPNGYIVRFKNVYSFVSNIAMQTGKVVNYDGYDVPISLVWNWLYSYVVDVYAFSLEEALKMSKESIDYSKDSNSQGETVVSKHD